MAVLCWPVVLREAVAKRTASLGVSKVGLLATRATVESGLYHDYLAKFGVNIITPGTHGQNLLDSIVDTLVTGMMPESLNLKLAQVISELKSKGVEAVVYGCTELSLLIGKVKVSIPLIDSLTEHVKLVVEKSLE
jgi:aspartate racemase